MLRIRGPQPLPHEPADHGGRDGGGLRGDLLCNLVGPRQEVLGVDDLADEAPGQRLVGVEDAARVEPAQRLLEADHAREEPA